MDVAEWQDRLERTFDVEALVPRSLLTGIRQEVSYKDYVLSTFRGFTVLMNCFFSLYEDTLSIATRQLHEEEALASDSAYRTSHLVHVSNFKSFRASDSTFLSGYPLDAMSLLRDLKDRAVFLSAVGQGLSSIHDLCRIAPRGYGEGPLTEDSLNTARNQRTEEERRVLRLMLRSKSGLSQEALQELGRWERLFHFEVHGSTLTRASTVSYIRKHRKFSLWPLPVEEEAAMYVCRASEMGWMLTRTLPLLQARAGAFGHDWSEKWTVLDDSFRYDQECFGKTGKPIAYAIIELIDTKFPFTPEWYHGRASA